MRKKTKSLLTLFMIVTFIFFNIPVLSRAQTKVNSEEQRVNFALEGIATASNIESGQENIWGPDKAIDGITNRNEGGKSKQSRWSTDVGNEERVLTVDLKKERIFDEFNIEWERTNIKSFNIKVSNDNINYTEVYSKPNKLNITELRTNIKLDSAVSGRYVKLSVTEYDGGDINWRSVSLYEFEVVGTVTNTDSENINLAKSAKVSASGSEDPSIFGPNKAIDGIVNRRETTNNKQSRWSSDLGISPKYLALDFGEAKKFQTLVIEWERKNANDYSIETSNDGENWTEVKSYKNSPVDYTQKIILDKAVSARYVRLYIANFVASGSPQGKVSVNWNAVSVYEFEVYGGNLDTETGGTVYSTENIALNKPATASSQEANNLIPEKAVDGVKNQDSRWASAVRSNEEWLRVDLQKRSTIKTVVIDWERRNATNYSIQISDDDRNWTTVKTINTYPKSLSNKIVLDRPVEGRYIRVLIKSHAQADQVIGGISWNNVSILEFSVYSGDLKASVEDILDNISPPKVGRDDEKLTMPKVAEGYNIKFVGADYEQVIDKDLIIHKPIVDTKISVTFEISKDGEKALTDPMEIIVPGKYKQQSGSNSKPVVIPEVREWFGSKNNFNISNSSRIVIDPVYKNQLNNMANTFAKDYKEIIGKNIDVVESTVPRTGDFYFTLSTKDQGLGKEGHLMTITDFIKVEAQDSIGAFWATRSILQILQQNKTTIPQGIVRDYPKYKVRGFMLDVGRKPFSLDYLYKTAKIMAWYKMNDFQIHLNDNYIFLGDYTQNGENPMNAYSGFRLESNIKKGGNNGLNKADLTSKDTFYTKAQFNKFIRDSRNIGVNIVPEFDTPAHSLAFIKVRPDLKLGNSVDHLNINNSQTLKFVKNLWNEYLDGDNPVFDKDTVVNIGTDEYDGGYKEEFRKYTDDLLGFMQNEKGRTVRLWGGLTVYSGNTPVRSKNVQMNIWNTGYSNPKDMFEKGFDLINMVDSNLYIVPGAGYYYDYLNKEFLYNSWQPNVMGNTMIPAGHEQMLGSSYAIWNDMIDKKDNHMTDNDIFSRFIDALPAFSSKLWGDAKDLSYNDFVKKVNQIGKS